MTTRIKSASLLEAIVAMILLMAVISVCFLVLNNISYSSLTLKKQRASALLINEMTETEKNQRFANEVIFKDSIQIVRKIITQEKASGLIRVNIAAYDASGKKLAVLEKIVTNEIPE